MPMNVDVRLGDKPTIRVSGKEIRPMREDQLEMLGGRGRLEELVRRFFGHNPDGVHISDETPGGKLRGTFAKYGWNPVKVTAEMVSGRIEDVHTELEGTVTQPVYNIDPDTPSHASHELWRERSNRVAKESHWNVGSTVSQSLSAKVEGGIDLGIKVGGEVSGTTGFEFSAGYGENKTKEQAVTIGSKAGISVDLEPMDATVLTLALNVGKVVARVDKRESISGGVFVHFGKRVTAPGARSAHYLHYVPLSRLYKAEQLRQKSWDILKIDNYVNSPVGNRPPEPGEIPVWEEAVRAWETEPK